MQMQQIRTEFATTMQSQIERLEQELAILEQQGVLFGSLDHGGPKRRDGTSYVYARLRHGAERKSVYIGVVGATGVAERMTQLQEQLARGRTYRQRAMTLKKLRHIMNSTLQNLNMIAGLLENKQRLDNKM